MRLSKSCIGQAEREAVTRVLEAEYLGMGQEVGLFEQELSNYIGHDREVICVSTGTAALHLALQAAGIVSRQSVQPAPPPWPAMLTEKQVSFHSKP